jgi:hypothetical protein
VLRDATHVRGRAHDADGSVAVPRLLVPPSDVSAAARPRHQVASSPVSDARLLALSGGCVVDDPDWVSWRWVVGLGGALTILGAGLFGFGDPVWMPVPVLLALVVPRLRDRSRSPISVAVLLVQNVPALAVLALVVSDALGRGELSDPVAVVTPVTILVAALGHGLWLSGQRGPVAGVAVVLAGWCAASVVSGWLSPLDEAHYVMGAMLLLGADVVSSLSPELREDTMILPTVATALFLLVFGGIPLLDSELVPQASAVVATAVVGLPVAWSIKRSARGRGRRQWSAAP